MALNIVSDLQNEAFSGEALFSEKGVSDYIKKISKIKPLTREEEFELAGKAKEGSVTAKQKLINANLKLVVTIARKVIHTSKLPMADLLQEGNIGLAVAVDKFNRNYGYRLATYASWWIKQAMFKAVSEQSHSVKIPVYIQETLSKYSKVKSELEKKLQKSVGIDDVAKKMNTDSEKIREYLNAYKKTLSIECDCETTNGSEVRLADILEDKKAVTEANIEYESLKNDISKAISMLKEREQKVITLRFGLNGKEKQTLEDIGKIYGVTKECIRQTESRVLAKLKTNESLFDLYVNFV